LGLNRYLYEPISSLTHIAGAIAAASGSIMLIILTWGEAVKMLSLGIFGVSMVTLYTVSALFHGIKLPEKKRMWLNRLDHGAIFLLIAGTYTPIVAVLYPSGWRMGTMIVIWLSVLVGILYKLFSKRIHGFLNASIYPVVSWAGVVPVLFFAQIKAVFSGGGIWLVALGGMIYMAGFFIYLFKKPDPWPDLFGHHEIWHLFVLGGTLCHYLFMVLYIVPHQT
jgi:hemolysin III